MASGFNVSLVTLVGGGWSLKSTTRSRLRSGEALSQAPAQTLLISPSAQLSDGGDHPFPEPVSWSYKFSSKMDASLLLLILRLESAGCPTIQDLCQLQIVLNSQCLRHYSNPTSAAQAGDYTPDHIKQLALYLTGPLRQTETWESSEFRSQQLRTLVATLALLHHMKVEELHTQPYSQLRENIADRFRDVVDGRRASLKTPAETIRYIHTVYLLRLSAQYFSLFGRRQSRLEALAVPVLGLVLTGASVVRNISFGEMPQMRKLTSRRRAANTTICRMCSDILIK